MNHHLRWLYDALRGSERQDVHTVVRVLNGNAVLEDLLIGDQPMHTYVRNEQAK